MRRGAPSPPPAAALRSPGLPLLVLLACLVPAFPAAAQSGAAQVCPYQVFGNDQKNPREILPGGDGILRLEFVTRVVEPACVPAYGLATCACTPGNCPGGCVCSAGTYLADTNTCTKSCAGGATYDPVKDSCSDGSQPVAAVKPSCAAGTQWSSNRIPLRMYGTSLDPAKQIDPDNPDDPNTIYGYPGPTMRVRKSSAPGKTDGTRLQLALYNRLPFQNYPGDFNACSPQCVIEPPRPIGKADPEKYPNGQLVCQNAPDCFHGDNATNMHFHGTHISPQPHSDFVLLTLLPKGAKEQHSHMHPHGDTVVGDYKFDINPIPWNQSEGTHWYHPHKHGSTAAQVLNGMAGALIIEGPFDDWLNRYYGVPGGGRGNFEKVLVLQQVWPNVNFYNPNDHLSTYPPVLLVNGQPTPVISMRPGETQRWRFINATMQAGAQLELDLAAGMSWRQIAQDGVQFAEVNYQCQPLYANSTAAMSTLSAAMSEACEKIYPASITSVMEKIPFSPGNRADFLVQAPSKPGTYHLMQQVVGNVVDRVRDKLNQRAEGLRQVLGAGEHPRQLVETGDEPANSGGTVEANGIAAPLFTIVVEGEPVKDPKAFPTTSLEDPACAKTPKPANCWPDTLNFLPKDLGEARHTSRTVTFSMDGTNPGQQPNRFSINGDGYCPSCSGETMELGSTEKWTITNDTVLNHPFHIHINPFQMTSYAGTELPQPWIWWDTVGLPTPAGGEKVATMQFLTRFEDFTGEYVLHCHFLGHEDRGMMENVQVVCPKDPGKFGTPVAGHSDDCNRPQGNASPSCKEQPCKDTGLAAGSHRHGQGKGRGDGTGKGDGAGHRD
jgi:FtsP/CotA-like multicopper oxidase with cupredoxin domain